MTQEVIERESLREVIASDAYAATFQTLRQYRQALLKQIDNGRPVKSAVPENQASETNS